MQIVKDDHTIASITCWFAIIPKIFLPCGRIVISGVHFTVTFICILLAPTAVLVFASWEKLGKMCLF